MSEVAVSAFQDLREVAERRLDDLERTVPHVHLPGTLRSRARPGTPGFGRRRNLAMGL